jgi:hypothetical protein
VENGLNIVREADMEQVLQIFDRLHFAKECKVSQEEQMLCKQVIITYVNSIYGRSKIYEKFIIRNIKCLYLDSKWVII